MTLPVVEHISDFVLVMHHGKIVEVAPAAEIYKNPQHEYTEDTAGGRAATRVRLAKCLAI